MIRGTFLGIEISKTGLLAARAGLDTTGHNIANSGTEGYSRQRVTQRASIPISFPGAFFTLRPGMIGTGTQITEITRIRSQFIDAQIQQEGGSQSRLSTLSGGLQSVEDIFGEPADAQFNGLTDAFFNAWEDLANDPESLSSRTNLREAAVALTSFVRNVDLSVKREVDGINEQVRGKVTEVNTLAAQIAALNKQISQAESGAPGGSLQANDLKDRRDQIVEQLSKIVNVRAVEGGDGSFTVLMEGHPIVTGYYSHQVGLVQDPADPVRPKLVFTKSNLPVPLTSGSLKGLFDLRDTEIPKVVDRFARLITAFTNRTNKLHLEGYGLDQNKGRSFFTDTVTRQAAGNIFLPGGTTLDTTLDQLNITSGDFFIQGQRIVIDPKEVLPGQAISLRQLLARIEQPNIDIRAELDTTQTQPRIVISQYNPASGADALKLVDGTSNFFEASGLDTAIIAQTTSDPPYSTSLTNFKVSSTILNNLDVIAATGDDGLGFPGPGDNRTALAIASLKNDQHSIYNTTFGEYFESSIAVLGSTGQTYQRSAEASTLVVSQLDAKRQEISGVNLDEEATQLIKYQKAFEASARAMTAVDETLDLIVNRLGIVGR